MTRSEHSIRGTETVSAERDVIAHRRHGVSWPGMQDILCCYDIAAVKALGHTSYLWLARERADDQDGGIEAAGSLRWRGGELKPAAGSRTTTAASTHMSPAASAPQWL